MLNLTIDTATAIVSPEPKVDFPVRQLLRPLPTPGEFLLVIDNSSLEKFTTCPKAADYGLVRRREPNGKNAALTFGGALHEGLEKFLMHQYFKQKGLYQYEFMPEKECDSRSSNDQDQAILRFFTENPAQLDEYRTVNNALAILAAYRERASLPDYAWEIQSDANGPIIERAFELPLGVVEVNSTFPHNGSDWVGGSLLGAEQHVLSAGVHVSRIHIAWSGRIDAVVRCNGAIRVVDHKTTSIAGDNFVQDFAISNQTLGYTWAGQQLWPELNPSAFCLNAIHFKKPTGSGAITGPGPRGGSPALNFFRAYFEYSAERVAQWQENTMMIVSDFIHCLVRDFYPRHTKWCHGKYGRCPYFDVCVQDDPNVRRNMLNSDMFKNVTWNPVNGR